VQETAVLANVARSRAESTMLPIPPYVSDITVARSILRAYVMTTLYRPSLPGTEAPALVLPRRPGFVSVNPERSFPQGLVRSLANRLPDEQRRLFEDLAVLTTKAAARRAGCTSATLRQRQEAALGWLLEVLYLQREEGQ